MAKEGRALRPEGRGRVLTAFLQAYFAAYMDYGFTAGMEDQLDAVSGVGWQPVQLLGSATCTHAGALPMKQGCSSVRQVWRLLLC